MRRANLLLEHAFFNRIRLDAVVAKHPEQKPGMSSINVTCDVKKHNEDPTRFLIQMAVTISPKDEKSPGLYEGELVAVGGFRVTENVQENDRADLVVVNGKAIMYGVIREMVANLSARGSHGVYFLPTVTFCDEAAKVPAVAPKKSKKVVKPSP